MLHQYIGTKNIVACIASVCIIFIAIGSVNDMLVLHDLNKLNTLLESRLHAVTPAREKLLLLQMRLKSILIAERSLFAAHLQPIERLGYYNRYQSQKDMFNADLIEADRYMRALSAVPGFAILWENGFDVLELWNISNDRVQETLRGWHAVYTYDGTAIDAALREENAAAMLQEAQKFSMGTLQILQLNAMDIIDNMVERSNEIIMADAKAIMQIVDGRRAHTQWLLAIYIACGVCLMLVLVGAYAHCRRTADKDAANTIATNERLSALFDTMPLGCIVRDKDMQLQYLNQSGAHLLGLEARWNDFEASAHSFGLGKWEYIDRYALFNFPEVQPDGTVSQARMSKMHMQALANGMVRTQWFYQKADGTPLPVMLTLQRIIWQGKEAVARYFEPLDEGTPTQSCPV